MPLRRQEQARDTNVSAYLSSSSLSSSLSSSAGSSMLLPAAPPSDSSQSDIATPDRSVHSSPAARSKAFSPSDAIQPVPRSSSLQPSMGQSVSTPDPVSSTPSKATSSAGAKLKRVFGVRRRKVEDVPPPLSIPKGKGRSVTAPVSAVTTPSSINSGFPHTPPQSAGFPPTPPPKSPHMQPGRTDVTSAVDQRGSLMIASPGISAALQYLSEADNEKNFEGAVVSRPRQKDQEQEKMKEDWRKSDSTTTSYYTVRPRSVTSGGSRTPRPVSMAESLHSTNTIVPANKRLSALLTEAEFVMTEEELPIEPSPSPRRSATPLARKTSPSGSAKTRKRHSISLHFTSPFPSSAASPSPTSPTASDAPYSPGRPAFVQRSTAESSSDMPALTRTAANGIIGPSRSDAFSQSTGSHIKGRLAALSAATTAPSSYQEPPARPASPSSRSITGGNTSLRQTAVSMTNGLAPAAGFAMGFGRRAVERMGRAFGGRSNQGGSGYSSSSSSIAGSDDVGRSHPNQSNSSHVAQQGKGKPWRTPNAPSGTWSISSASTSSTGPEVDTYGLAGPSLGTRIRGSMRNGSGGSIAGGLVFGRELRACVRDTALDPVRHALNGKDSDSVNLGGDSLEQRLLPALVVRCVQHLLKWGVEEEGLFRISGRASHVARLRSEFDTGADWDMLECAPGDLDPHAVSSVFKAYLRELPEPILTHALNPFFEAAMIAETNARKSEETNSPTPKGGARGPSLPSGPRDGHALRKPPSLSTLAMPSFAGMRPPSAELLAAFASLVARLPRENRDLLRTVAELINVTSKRKDIRMPLSNLTVVFCPSLNMSPPILRVFCEAEGIWDGPVKGWEESVVLDIKRDSKVVIDIRAEDTSAEDGGDGTEDDDYEESQLTPPAVRTQTATSSTDQTVELDESSNANDTSTGMEVAETDISEPAGTMQASIGDNASSVSTNESRPSTPPPNAHYLYNPHSPSALTSSTDSLATPSTLSEDPSVSQQTTALKETLCVKVEATSPPEIADVDDHPPLISARLPPTVVPIEFPMTGSAPSTPISPAQPTSASSVPSLTLEQASSSDSVSRRTRKRPSLTALFSKRSGSSLRSSRLFPSSPFLSAQGSPTGSSPSTPASQAQSMVTAQGSTSSLPPVLDTPIDSSRLIEALGVEDQSGSNTEPNTTASVSSDPLRGGRPFSMSPLSSPIYSPISPPASATPVAGQFRHTADEMKSSRSPGHGLRGQTSQSSFASVDSSATYHRLSLWEDDEEAGPPDDDWASSVFMDVGWTAPSEPTERGHGRT
ncbi:RhoGAP-domain-containing protein [Artomyces pyxidatus]|uniref:RhoGAP-domain-containing protein n=1 Tax=Artomyces pyxidatus TaxID=48021 RepID=A0ACB8TCW0_9AGAM|nr:RhoGAP-domain-containing protein [Artomyces pyxidatus]